MICPTCKCDTLDPGLAVNEGAEQMAFMGEVRALTPTQTQIMIALYQRFAHILSHSRIEHILWGNREDGGPDTARDVIKVQISTLRRKLKGWPFVIVNSWGHGYSLCRAEVSATDGGRSKSLKTIPSDKYGARAA